jgi:hypothetical protein
MLAVHDPVSAGIIGYMLQGVIQEYKCIEWKYNTGFFLIWPLRNTSLRCRRCNSETSSTICPFCFLGIMYFKTLVSNKTAVYVYMIWEKWISLLPNTVVMFFPLSVPRHLLLKIVLGSWLEVFQHSTGTSCTEVKSIVKNWVVNCACAFITE